MLRRFANTIIRQPFFECFIARFDRSENHVSRLRFWSIFETDTFGGRDEFVRAVAVRVHEAHGDVVPHGVFEFHESMPQPHERVPTEQRRADARADDAAGADYFEYLGFQRSFSVFRKW